MSDRGDISRAWNALAGCWSELQSEAGDGNQRWIINPALFALVGEVSGLRVLDAACGAGHISRALAGRGAIVTAIDCAESMIRIAQREETERPLGISYGIGDVTSMPQLANNSFDIVVCSMALMNIARPDKAFAEFSRVLRPGGRLVFSIPHPCYPRPFAGHGVQKEGSEELDYYRVDDYLTEHEYELSISSDEAGAALVKVPTFHRTIGTYVSLLAGAGFVIDGLVEPKPVDSAEARRELGAPWWEANNRIAYWLVVRARLA